MPQFKPFDLGNSLAKGVNIRGARTRNALAEKELDPNSPRNQLIQEQLTGARQGNVIAQSQEQRAQTTFDQKQQEQNTKILYQALTEISQNPAAANFHVPKLKEMGILRGDFDHSNMTPEEIQAKAAEGAAAIGKALEDPTKKEKSGIAGTAMERARNIYGYLTKKMEKKIPLTEDEEIEYGNAVNALQQERLKLDPQGNLTSFKPELPVYGQQPKGGGSRIVAEGKKTKTDKNKISRVRQLTKEVRDLVKGGEDQPFYKRPTGPAGYITSKTQGLRDLGVPVPRAGFETSKRIEEINFLLAPYISGEKGRGISNYDRQRIEKLLGSIDSPLKFDADAVLSAMDIVESYGDRLEDEISQTSKKGPESLKDGESGVFDGKKYRKSGGKLQVWED